MIVVKIELWKGGNPKDVESLGLLTIANVGGTATKGNYEFTLFQRGAQLKLWRQGRIFRFKRKQFQVWYLISGVLRQMFTQEKLEKAFDVLPFRTFEESLATPGTTHAALRRDVQRLVRSDSTDLVGDVVSRFRGEYEQEFTPPANPDTAPEPIKRSPRRYLGIARRSDARGLEEGSTPSR